MICVNLLSSRSRAVFDVSGQADDDDFASSGVMISKEIAAEVERSSVKTPRRFHVRGAMVV